MGYFNLKREDLGNSGKQKTKQFSAQPKNGPLDLNQNKIIIHSQLKLASGILII